MVWHGYRHGLHYVHTDYVPAIDNAIFHNRDSLLLYAEYAYKYEDPGCLCMTAVASYMVHYYDKAAKDSLPYVSLEEADIMLLRSAELGCEEAYYMIHYFDQSKIWHSHVPEYNYDSLHQAFKSRPRENGYIGLRVDNF